jgi:hypothetical protein
MEAAVDLWQSIHPKLVAPESEVFRARATPYRVSAFLAMAISNTLRGRDRNLGMSVKFCKNVFGLRKSHTRVLGHLHEAL